MLSFMQHIEIHVIESETDVDLAIQSGLLEPEHIELIECDACEDLLGHSSLSFTGFAVVLDDVDVWTVCLDCADPVITGGSLLDPISDSFEYLVELDLEDLDPLD